ncbi:MAG: metallophosphoesterase [Eubacteriales bacterium]|nr:metallophosphoesterase [Eubacteriales bacterium]
MKARFLVFTDLHVDIMHDAVARMEIICEAAAREHVDFLLHLGDVMYPDTDFLRQHAPESLEARKRAWFLNDRDDEKREILRLLAATGLKLYGVLGNHDMDACDKRAACLYWGMPGPYYAFVEGGVRFLALDSNFIRTEEGLIDFEHCNYSGYKRRQTSFLPERQLRWLREQALASAEPCVLLTHTPLGDDLLNVNNMQEVWAILRQVNADRRRVVLAMNGHNHVDGLSVREGVPFLSFNSASNIWLGADYATTRYSETLSRVYSHLPPCAPYYDPLYAVVQIDDDGIHVQGTESRFVGPTPQQLGFPVDRSYFYPSARISSHELPLSALAGDGAVFNANHEPDAGEKS